MHDIAIPLAAIAHVGSRESNLPSPLWVLQPETMDAGVHLNVAVSGQVNVHVWRCGSRYRSPRARAL